MKLNGSHYVVWAMAICMICSCADCSRETQVSRNEKSLFLYIENERERVMMSINSKSECRLVVGAVDAARAESESIREMEKQLDRTSPLTVTEGRLGRVYHGFEMLVDSYKDQNLSSDESFIVIGDPKVIDANQHLLLNIKKGSFQVGFLSTEARIVDRALDIISEMRNAFSAN